MKDFDDIKMHGTTIKLCNSLMLLNGERLGENVLMLILKFSKIINSASVGD
jgi:hypothetical protein